MNELITIEQLPIITQHLEAKSIEIKAKTAEYLTMICTDETVKVVKSARAELNNEKKDFEAQRIAIKNKIMEPYNAFDKIYKACITDIYADADVKLKAKIDDVEDGIKALHTEVVRGYFDSYLEDFPTIDFLQFERVGLNITKSANVEVLKKQCADFINKVSDDLDMIALQPDQAEILVEYIPTLNAAQAITTIAAKHRAIELQKAAIEAQKVVYVPVAAKEPEPVDDFAIPDFSPADFDFPAPAFEKEHEEVSEETGKVDLVLRFYDTPERLCAMQNMLNATGYSYDEC